MDKTCDTLFAFTAPNGAPSRCRIRVYEEAGRLPVVLATQLVADPEAGMSVTNAAAELAGQVWRDLLPQAREGLRWIEHYPPRSPDVRGDPTATEDIDEVTFTLCGPYTLAAPRWRPLGRARAEGLIGQSID